MMSIFLVIYEWLTPLGEWRPERVYITASDEHNAVAAIEQANQPGVRIYEVRWLVRAQF